MRSRGGQFGILLLFLLSAVRMPAQTAAPDSATGRFPSVLDSPADFSGWRGETTPPNTLDSIRIGYFAPDAPGDPVGAPMLDAANLAITEANAGGGYQGVPFRLVIRWNYHPWGAASKQVTHLVFRDSVWAVIGSLDGRFTHIAEQIVTKAWVPLLAPVSADPTLNYVRVPWMFRLPPDEKKQAAVLVRDGIKSLPLQSIGVITSTDHDGRTFASELLPWLEKAGSQAAFHFEISSRDFDVAAIVRRLGGFHPDGVILRLPREELLALMTGMGKADISVPVFLPWIPGVSPEDLRSRSLGNVYCIRPFDPTGNARYQTFETTYRARFGVAPTPAAAYTYDAVQILLRAIRTSGLSRAGIRDAIAGMQDYQGVTGKIHWDNGWANQAEPVLQKISSDSSDGVSRLTLPVHSTR